MSGPIIRKYGFANFEKIFGPREIQHGVDEPDDTATPSELGKPSPTEPVQTSRSSQGGPAARAKQTDK